MSQHNSRFRVQVVVAFALVYLLWGSTYLGIRIVVEHVPSVVMSAVRFTSAGALMLVCCALCGKRVRVTRQEFVRLTVIGILLLAIGNVLLGISETYISSGLAALLLAITPLWFLLLERITLRSERITARAMTGILLGLLGVIVLLWPSLRVGLRLGQRELLGAGLVLINSITWASGSIVSKRWRMDIDPYIASAWEMLMAGIVDVLIALPFGKFGEAHWNRSSVAAIGYLVIFGSLLGFTAYIWLLHNVVLSKVTTYAYVNPIVAVFLGWLVLREPITSYILAGSVIVVISVILVTGAKRSPEMPPPEPEALPTLVGAKTAAD